MLKLMSWFERITLNYLNQKGNQDEAMKAKKADIGWWTLKIDKGAMSQGMEAASRSLKG